MPIDELIDAVQLAILQVDAHRPTELPALNAITLTVETFAKEEASGELKLYAVTADGKVSTARTQTIKLVLEPPPPVTAENQVRALRRAIPLDELLSKTIIRAAEDAGAALADGQTLTLAEFTVTVKFVVDAAAAVGVQLKPVGDFADIGASGKISTADTNTNSIEITFKPLEPPPSPGSLSPSEADRQIEQLGQKANEIKERLVRRAIIRRGN
jgi:hypothetical protein